MRAGGMWEAPKQAEGWGQGSQPWKGWGCWESPGLGSVLCGAGQVFPTGSSDLGQCYGTGVFLGLSSGSWCQEVGTPHPPGVVTVTTISVELVTKGVVARTTVTRYKGQVIGSQFCVETGSSPSPSSITP